MMLGKLQHAAASGHGAVVFVGIYKHRRAHDVAHQFCALQQVMGPAGQEFITFSETVIGENNIRTWPNLPPDIPHVTCGTWLDCR